MALSRNAALSYEFGAFRLIPSEHRLLRKGEPVALPPKTFETLVLLVENSGHLVEKAELMKALWPDTFVEEANLTHHVWTLRKALAEGAMKQRFIETVPRHGYRFVADVQCSLAEPADFVVEKHTFTHIVTETNDQHTFIADERPEQQQAIVYASPSRKKLGIALIVALACGLASGAVLLRGLIASRSKPITSIAVLPFANTSADEELEYLSNGLSESLIDSLSQLPQVKVIAHSSSFTYKGKTVDPEEVARNLGVQAILVGRVAKHRDNLIVSAELVDARDRTQVWGGQYIRKPTDIQAIQEEITRTISEKLRSRLNGAQGKQLPKHATENSQAYQFYLNGLFHFRKGLPEDIRKSLDYFSRAVELDPDFALAWVGVAKANRYFSGNSLLEPKEVLARAKTATQKALELDDSLAEAHLSLAAIKLDEWDWSGAEREYKRALELNPNLVEVHTWYSWYLSTMARHEEALQEISRAQEVDPLDAALTGREAWALVLAGRNDEAIRKYQLMQPGVGVYFGLGFAYEHKGMYRKASEEFEKGIALRGTTTSGLCYLGFNLAMAGRMTEAQSVFSRLKKTKEYVSPEELAGFYVALGKKEEALAALERAYAEHDLQMQVLKIDWRLDSIRSDPRFQDLLRRVGLPT